MKNELRAFTAAGLW